MSYPQDLVSCTLCGNKARVAARADSDSNSVSCGQCGSFNIPGMLSRTVLRGNESEPETKDLVPYLRCYIRQANLRGETVQLTADNWQNFAQAHANVPVTRRLEKLLELTASRSKPGAAVKFDDKHRNFLGCWETWWKLDM
jgi:hypothetical protein